MANALQDFYTPVKGDDVKIDSSNDLVAGIFIASSSYNLNRVDIQVYRVGSPGNITVTVQATVVDGGAYAPDGVDLLTPTIFDGNTITADVAGEFTTISFPDTASITSGTRYAIVISGASTDGSNYVEWISDDGDQSYTGLIAFSSNGGSSWDKLIDFGEAFKAYSSFNPPSEKATVRRLVAVAADKLWFEDI